MKSRSTPRAVHDAAARGDVGTVIRLARKSSGMTQGELGEACGYSQSAISRIERGRTPAYDVRTLRTIAAALDMPARLLGVIDAPKTNTENEPPVNRRQFLTSTAAVATSAALPLPEPNVRVGGADVARLQDAVRELYSLDDHYGGGAVYTLALRHLGHVRHLVGTASYSTAVGRKLHGRVGQLTEHAAWTAFDAGGRHDVARRLWTEALTRARIAEDDQLAVLVMASLCLQACESGSAREALALAETAQRTGTRFATPRLSSLLSAREALAHARLRDAASCHAALIRAERQLDEGDDADDPEWLAFYGSADFYSAIAAARLLLGAPEDAESVIRSALDANDSAYPRNRGIYLARLAETLVTQGNLDEGVSVASAAVAQLSEVSSGRVRGRLQGIRHQLAPHASAPEVRDYLDWSASIVGA